jgi:mannose/fructose/N-acetylgalactosamine-specific phosphotransferase system component IID
MKTPLSFLLMAIAYWIAIYGVTLVPQHVDNYQFNLFWLTLVIPNVLRLVVGNIPRLAVDRLFFLSTTLIAWGLTYGINLISKETKEGIKSSTADRSKKLKTSFLLMGTFAAGALITYYVGIDTSIYSNMGWETPA